MSTERVVMLIGARARPGDYQPGQCCVTVGAYEDAVPCTAPAVDELTVGCTHEHIAHQPICGNHEQLRDRRAGDLLGLCRRCYETDGHQCRVMLFERTPLQPQSPGV